MSDSLQIQLQNLHQLFCETRPDDPKTVRDYAWTVAKQLNANIQQVDSLTCRQLLADCISLPIERPSNLYSALLSAAVKVSGVYPEFRFAAFLKMWGLPHLRPEDRVPRYVEGKSVPSLRERVAKALARSLAVHSQDRVLLEEPEFGSLLADSNRSVQTMLVTRIQENTGKDGRKLFFVTLTSPEGIEVECVSSLLQPHPLHPLPEGKRHYANIGQLYDCSLYAKKDVQDAGQSQPTAELRLGEAYLSQTNRTDLYAQEFGYVESVDRTHGQMHIYDRHSRHFVASVLRFSKEKAGDFVRFIPIVPQASKFKTAVLLSIISGSALTAISGESPSLIRQIRITGVNGERHYASWELIDKGQPVTELLSPLQRSQGEVSPAFSNGFLSLTEDNRLPQQVDPSGRIVLAPGQELSAVIYLKRGKDKQKRPHVARLC